MRRGRQRNKAHFAYRRMFQVQPCRVRPLKHRFVFYDTLVCMTDMTIMFLDMTIMFLDLSPCRPQRFLDFAQAVDPVCNGRF